MHEYTTTDLERMALTFGSPKEEKPKVSVPIVDEPEPIPEPVNLKMTAQHHPLDDTELHWKVGAAFCIPFAVGAGFIGYIDAIMPMMDYLDQGQNAAAGMVGMKAGMYGLATAALSYLPVVNFVVSPIATGCSKAKKGIDILVDKYQARK